MQVHNQVAQLMEEPLEKRIENFKFVPSSCLSCPPRTSLHAPLSALSSFLLEVELSRSSIRKHAHRNLWSMTACKFFSHQLCCSARAEIAEKSLKELRELEESVRKESHEASERSRAFASEAGIFRFAPSL